MEAYNIVERRVKSTTVPLQNPHFLLIVYVGLINY